MSDVDKPSQAEGDDDAHPDTEEVLAGEGRPSQAEGEDPEHPDEHEVLDPE